MNIDCYGKSVFAKGLAAACILLLLPMLYGSAQAQEEPTTKWLDVGELAHRYASTGSQGLTGPGMVWPYLRGSTGSLDAYHDGMRLWIGAKNFTDTAGTEWAHKIAYTEPQHNLDDVSTTAFKTVCRFSEPEVLVDQQPSQRVASACDEVDPTMGPARKIVNVVNTLLGVTMRKEILAFSQGRHDNYHVIDITLTNTGNVDLDEEIELPDQTTDSLYLWWDRRWGQTEATAAVIGRGATWGDWNMQDVVRDADMKAYITWQGWSPQLQDWNPVGAPAFDNQNEAFVGGVDTSGQLHGIGFTGTAKVHADVSAENSSNDPEQPRTMWWGGANPANALGTSDSARTAMQQHYEEWFEAGVVRPTMADSLCPEGDFAHCTENPDINDGGRRIALGFGPYTLEPGQSVNIVVSEGVDGLTYEAGRVIGKAAKRLWEEGNQLGDIEYDADGDGAIQDDEVMDKNEWVMTGRDSLLNMWEGAIANYESGYAIPKAPRPPSVFRVNSSGSGIQLEWAYPEGEPDPPGGFEVYRASAYYQGNPVDDFIYENVADLPGDARAYEDASAEAGVDYFYYIQAVGEVNQDGTAMTPTGAPLKSSRYYTQTYDPVSVEAVSEEGRYYVGPDGSDSNTGISPDDPLGTFDEAVSRLTPGDTLFVLDGVYESSGNDGRLLVSGKEGTETAPIVIKAQHERQAWLQGDGDLPPLDVVESSWIVVEGLRASSADNPNDARSGSAVRVVRSDHITLRRLLAHHNNRYLNASLIGGPGNHHILVEECEAYFFHRHGISFYKSDYITIRRSFVHARNATDVPGGWGSHGCCTQGGDEGFSFYFTSNSILENSVSMQTEQLSIIGGVPTVLENPGGQNNQMLGNISYKDLRPGFLQSRKFKDDRLGGFSGPSKNITIKDYLIVGGQDIDEGASFSPVVAQDMTIEGATWINTEHTPIFANPDTRELDTRYFMGCDREEVGGCDYDIRNALFINDEPYSNSSLLYAPDDESLNFLVEYANAWDALDFGFGVEEDITDSEGQYQQSRSVEPTGIGLGQGECIAFVPEGSNMSGTGADGADIGANILYRYHDGELTDEPLWDPQTGEFPHGAVIEDSPNDPDEHEVTAANIHEHLNVNTNGCTLPYSSGKVAAEEPGEVPDALRLQQNYPNPFNPATQIRFALPQAGRATLVVYDVLGREVATLVDRPMTAGEHQVRFEAGHLPSGLYLYRLEAGGRTRVQKMMLVR